MAFQPALDSDGELALVAEYQDGWTVRELTIIYRVSERTVYRILAKHRVPRHTRKRAFQHTRKQVKPKKPRELKPCGTNAAYQRHRSKGEYPCTACLEAHAENVKEAKAKRDKARSSDLARRQRREVRDLSAQA